MDLLSEKISEVLNSNNKNSRKELLDILIKDESLITSVFEYLNEDEKKEYFYYTYRFCYIDYLEKMEFVEMLELISKKIDKIKDYDLYYICNELKSEKDKEIFLDIFHKNINQFHIKEIIEKLSSDELKIKFISKFLYKNFFVLNAIKGLSDFYKEIYINQTDDISNQVEIILSLNNHKMIEKYALLPKYSNYRSLLVVATNNSDFIINTFKKINVYAFRVNVIKRIEDEQLKLRLIELLDDNNLKEFLISNMVKEKDLLNSLNGTLIDNNITIGVELECSNKNIEKYKKVEKVFKNYTIKSDSSVKQGFEIVSPILHYDIKELNTLKNVCNLLRNNNFYTDKTAGGHIHIGASYLDKKEDYYMLLYLYINTEDILYYISDRKNTLKRKSINRYAQKNKESYIEAIDNGIFEKDNNMETLFNEINENRYKGLNFKNINVSWKNTIEFRMPNGEIDFEELLLNIKLFARLVEISHKIVELDDDNNTKIMAMQLSKTVKEKDRLEILLNILFDNEEERQLYRDRYFANKRLYLLSIKNLLNKLKTVLKAEKLVEIEDNNHLIRSKN